MNQPSDNSPRFDSNRAWQEASAAVSANRDALIALAGVFIALPAFALAVLLPAPEPQPGSDLDAALELAGVYFREIWPVLIVLGVLSVIGTMAMLTLFGHASRPTVGEAIRKGLAATPVAILAQLILGFVMTGLALFPLSLAALAGSQGLAALGIAAGVALAAWFWIRTSMTTPVIAIDGERNPLAALRRSFMMTRGNAARLLFFFFLLILAFVIAGQLLQLALSLIAQGLAGAEAALIAGAFTGTLVQTAMSVYLTAALASSHRQLGESASRDIPATFG